MKSIHLKFSRQQTACPYWPVTPPSLVWSLGLEPSFLPPPSSASLAPACIVKKEIINNLLNSFSHFSQSMKYQKSFSPDVILSTTTLVGWMRKNKTFPRFRALKANQDCQFASNLMEHFTQNDLLIIVHIINMWSPATSKIYFVMKFQVYFYLVENPSLTCWSNFTLTLSHITNSASLTTCFIPTYRKCRNISWINNPVHHFYSIFNHFNHGNQTNAQCV